MNNHLLNMRNLWSRNFHSQITSGYHNTICHFNDFINIFQTFCILNLSNNCNFFGMMFFKDFTDFLHTFCISDKRSCNKIYFLFNTKDNVCFIFFRNNRQLYFYIWNVNSFLFSQFSSIYHTAMNSIIRYFFYFQFD